MADQAAGLLRVLEPLQPGLGQRVDADDGGAGALGPLQGGEHPGVVGARVLARDDDQIGLVEVLEADTALADAEGLGERRAGGLVAHVGAVRQVVGAEPAGEQLVGERGLVAGPARGVERGAVRGVQGPQFLGDEREGVVPGDRGVVGGALVEEHRRGEPALLAEPVAGALGEFGDRVRGEELGADPALGGLLGDGLGAVLAELGGVRLARLGPGAAGAVEAVGLVDLEQGAEGAADTHLLGGHPQAVADRGQPGGRVLGRGHPGGVLRRIALRGLLGHDCAPCCACGQRVVAGPVAILPPGHTPAAGEMWPKAGSGGGRKSGRRDGRSGRSRG